MDNNKQTIGPPWTSRKRMHAAMLRLCPDRVPTMPQICYGHAVNILYDDYRKGIADVIEKPAMEHELILEIARRYKIDGLRLFTLGQAHKVIDDGDVMAVFDPKTNERIGIVDVLGGGGIIPDKPARTVESVDDVDKLQIVPCDELMEQAAFIQLKESVEKAHKEDFFVASANLGFTMNLLSEVRGRERALFDLIDNPDLVQRIMDKGVEIAIEHGKALVKCGVDCIYIGDPASSGSLISPEHFKEFCKPKFSRFYDEVCKTDGVLAYMHICGNSNPILEMMADTGVNCVEPLDPLGGMKVADAKKRIGHRTALMGGVNTLTLLQGTPEQVYDESTNCCRDGGANGGYILAAGDMVPDFAPEQNLLAMVRAAKDFQYK